MTEEIRNIRWKICEMAGGDEELLFFDPPPDNFDDCIVGIANRCGMEPVVCYDREKVLESLAKEFAEDEFEDTDSDPETAAIEWFEFNTIGAWIGEKTPIFITFLDKEGGDVIEEKDIRVRDLESESRNGGEFSQTDGEGF